MDILDRYRTLRQLLIGNRLKSRIGSKVVKKLLNLIATWYALIV